MATFAAARGEEQLQQAPAMIFSTEAPDRRSWSGMRSPGVVPSKLFIGGLTRHTTTKHLRDHFSQYGRVLDCVAMRQLDGRPRGFGYVTLDSPAAAEACLQTPQIIDGRVVDMKRAVPGFAMDSPSHAGQSPAASGARGRKGSSPMLPPGTWDTLGPFLGSDPSPAAAVAAAAWASSWAAAARTPAGAEMLDCLELLRCGGAPPSPASMLGVFPETPSGPFCMGSGGAVCESLGLLTAGYGAGLSSQGSLSRSSLSLGRMASEDGSPGCTPARGRSSGTLSASAAEFVPRARAAGDRNGVEGLDDDTPQKVESSLKPARSGRAVLGEITNIMGAGIGGKSGAGGKSWSPVKAPLPSAAGDIGTGLLKVFEETAAKPGMQVAEPAPMKPGLAQGRENRPPPLVVYEDGEDENGSDQNPREQSASEDNGASEDGEASDDSVAAAVAARVALEERRERRITKSEDSQQMGAGSLTAEAALSLCGMPPGLSPPQRRLSQVATPSAGILSTVPVQPEAAVATVAAGVAAAPRTWTPKIGGAASLGCPALLSTTPKAANPPQAALAKPARKHSQEFAAVDSARTGCVWSREELLSHRIVLAKESVQ